MTENAIAKEIIDAAFRVPTTLGPGLLESVYDTVLAYEPGRRGLRTVRQQPIDTRRRSSRQVAKPQRRIGTVFIVTLKTRLASGPRSCAGRPAPFR